MRHLASLSLLAGLAGLALTAATATPAAAFCGFYVGGAGAEMFNNATEVVLMRHGTTTVLSMENNYQGPPAGFALVVPVPVVVREAQVKTLPREVFAKVDTLGAPRLVEYWEQDPCAVPIIDPMSTTTGITITEDYLRSVPAGREFGVVIEAQFSVGEYDIVVLSASESTGLDRWLRANKYEIPAGAEPLLRPYVEAGTKFFVAKVDPKKVQFVNGMATLSPLRVQYDATDFALPIRLGLANSSGTQDLIVNILAPNNTRYEVANYPNVTIPTNLAVKDEVRARFGEFYAALFDHTLAKAPGAVVTEYAWDTGNCDPCPGPVLDGNDLATLGADVLMAQYQDVGYAFTLTRLHARYGKEVGDDLVFRAVGALQGGRGTPDTHGVMPVDTAPAESNNFQGRYAILHPWTGPVACASPQPGIWGGPQGNAIAAPQAAQNLAFAPRGKVELSTLVAQDVPAVGVLASGDQPLPLPVRKPPGCTCQAAGGGVAASSAVVLLGAIGLATRRRRARR